MLVSHYVSFIASYQLFTSVVGNSFIFVSEFWKFVLIKISLTEL